MCKPPKQKIRKKLSKEYYKNYKTESEKYYKPVNLWVGRKAIKKLYENTGISKEIIQILVGSSSIMASSYPTTKRYTSSALSSYNP